MKALVTGATGFIGSHLVDTLLEEGYHVRILTRPQSTTNLTGTHLETQEGDLLDPHSLHKACTDIDLIFHLAADPRDWGNKHTIIQTNLTGTHNLLDASLHKKVTHVIFMSSAAVYGFPHTTTPLTEDTPLHPTPAYGESKLQAEQLLWKYGIDHHIHVTAIRSPLATGPRDRLAAPALLPAIKNRRLFTIGDGQALCQKIADAAGTGVVASSDEQPWPCDVEIRTYKTRVNGLPATVEEVIPIACEAGPWSGNVWLFKPNGKAATLVPH